MMLKEGLAEVMYMPPSEFYPYYWANGSTPTSNNNKSISTVSKDTSLDISQSYMGSARSKKFHELSCEWGKKISEKNKVIFNSRQEAINSEYVPCKACNP